MEGIKAEALHNQLVCILTVETIPSHPVYKGYLSLIINQLETTKGLRKLKSK